MVPMYFTGTRKKRAKSLEILELVGLVNKSKKVQRVAIRDGKISSEKILKENYAKRIKELGSLNVDLEEVGET